jgi:nicotinamidase-related amidase
MKALIIVDVQNGLINKNLYKKEEFNKNIYNEILKNKMENNEIIFIQHNSETLKNGTKNWELYSELIEELNFTVIQKNMVMHLKIQI